MIKKLLILLVVSFSQIEAKPVLDFSIQYDPNHNVSLDSISSDQSSYWYVLENEITEENIPNLNEENFFDYHWKRIKIPGNLPPNEKKEYNSKDCFPCQMDRVP